jgi:hypothetical protein
MVIELNSVSTTRYLRSYIKKTQDVVLRIRVFLRLFYNKHNILCLTTILTVVKSYLSDIAY